jgi:hypothetical protein
LKQTEYNVKAKEEQDLKRNVMIWAIVLIIPAIYGCTTIHDRQARMELNRGRSYETARFNQILNADTESNNDPVEGLDGNAADITIDKYQKGFKKEQSTTNVFNISVDEK